MVPPTPGSHSVPGFLKQCQWVSDKRPTISNGVSNEQRCRCVKKIHAHYTLDSEDLKPYRLHSNAVSQALLYTNGECLAVVYQDKAVAAAFNVRTIFFNVPLTGFRA